jgi:hypothetical protein
MEIIQGSEYPISGLVEVGPPPIKPPVEGAKEPIPKPGNPINPEDSAKAPETVAPEGEAKATKPTGLAEVSPTAEASKEIVNRALEIGAIIMQGIHAGPAGVAVAIVEAVGLMFGAVGTAGGLVGAAAQYRDNPIIETAKAIGTGGSVAATVTETILAGTTAIGSAGLIAAGSVGLGAFTLTELALKASAGTAVGDFVGGGIGAYLGDVHLSPAGTRADNRDMFGGSGIGY